MLLPLPKPPKKCTFKLVPNSREFINKANNASEIYDLEGAYWEFELELANVPEADALALDAFIASLRGRVGKFLLFDYRRAQETNPYTAKIDGDNQDGNTLLLKGLPANTLIARAGEKCQIGSANVELKMLTKDVQTNSQGRGNMVFESPLRRIFATDTPVYFNKPKGEFRLVDNNQGLATAQYKKGVVTSWKIRGREAF